MFADATVHTTGINWQSVGVILTGIGIIVIPFIALLVRMASKWTRAEDRMNVVVKDIAQLVHDRERMQTEILTQMREDRKATDERLRWLETHLWNRRRIGPFGSLPFCYISVTAS